MRLESRCRSILSLMFSHTKKSCPRFLQFKFTRGKDFSNKIADDCQCQKLPTALQNYLYFSVFRVTWYAFRTFLRHAHKLECLDIFWVPYVLRIHVHVENGNGQIMSGGTNELAERKEVNPRLGSNTNPKFASSFSCVFLLFRGQRRYGKN